MTGGRLSQAFFDQNAVELAPQLLGQILCRQTPDGILRLPITETEAYYTEADTACHAHKGRTKRTEILYHRGGCAYIYLCYGIHHLLNVVCGEEDVPQAVLIRGAGQYDGPGKLTRALQIDMALNSADFMTSDELWLEQGAVLPYTQTPRIGIQYADEADRNALWRFVAK